MRDNAHVMGLSLREAVALAARPRSPSQQRRLGYSGAWTPAPSRLSNQYFKVGVQAISMWAVSGYP